MKNTLAILIKRKAYPEETFIAMLNSYMTWGQITPEEYNELMLLLLETYHPAPPVEPEQPPVEPQEETPKTSTK